MSLWQRTPREVYRVYDEDQYLEGEHAPQEEVAAAGHPAFSARVEGNSSPRPGGPHAGRLVAFGLLVGIGLATLVLVALNVVHRQAVARESLAHESPASGPLVHESREEAAQRAARASGTNPVQAIAHSESTTPAQARLPALRTVVSPQPSGLPRKEASVVYSACDSQPMLTCSAEPWSTGGGEPTSGAAGEHEAGSAGLPARAPVEASAQDEFGFER